MATKTSTQLFNEVRDTMAGVILSALTNAGYELIQVTDAKWSIPYVDAEGNEKFVKITFSVPTGSRADNEPYDGYAEAEDYKCKTEQAAIKKAENDRKKAAKIEKDKAMRKAKKTKNDFEKAKNEGIGIEMAKKFLREKKNS